MSKSTSSMKSNIINIRNISLLIMVSLYIYFNIEYPSTKRLIFLLVTTILTFYLFNDIYSSVILSIVLSLAFTLLCNNRTIVEGYKNDKTENKGGNRSSPGDGGDGDESDDDDEDGSHSDNFINYNETMKNNLKNLDIKNIEKMTSETRELLNTQKELMATIAGIAPLLKEGMGLVNTFKNAQNK